MHIMKNNSRIIPGIFLLAVFFSLSGCATVALRETLPTYNLNGAVYYALIPLCEARGVNWEYDTFTGSLTLTKSAHRVSLKTGDKLVLVDQRVVFLNHPVDIYSGTVVVPSKFKEQVMDVLFKETKVPPKPTRDFLLSSQIKKIVIDAGHGGHDPGAIGRSGLREKDVNLDIAKRLAILLKSEGVEVVMTRNSDKFIPLDSRAAVANREQADLFVSIHSNANRVRSLNGFEAYCVATSVNDTKRALLAAKNARLNLDSTCLLGQSLDLKAILWDMLYTYNRAESIQLAREICKSVGNNLDIRVIGVKDARYEVLRSTRMPGVLVESGFLSNSKEERMLKNSFYRQKVAESIMDGIRVYGQALASAEAGAR